MSVATGGSGGLSELSLGRKRMHLLVKVLHLQRCLFAPGIKHLGPQEMSRSQL